MMWDEVMCVQKWNNIPSFLQHKVGSSIQIVSKKLNLSFSSLKTGRPYLSFSWYIPSLGGVTTGLGSYSSALAEHCPSRVPQWSGPSHLWWSRPYSDQICVELFWILRWVFSAELGLLLIRDVVEPGLGCLDFFKLHNPRGKLGSS